MTNAEKLSFQEFERKSEDPADIYYVALDT